MQKGRSLSPLPVAPPRSCEAIVQQIVEQIRAGHLVSGQKLPTEVQLGDTYHVSRAVVREAVRTLDAMGLVEARRGSGSYVRNDPIPSITHGLSFSVTPDECSVSSLFEFRATLEASAAYFAALRATPTQVLSLQQAAAESRDAAQAEDVLAFRVADDAFHRTLSEAADNAYLGVSVAAVRHMQNAVTHLITPMRGTISAAQEHLHIAAAIATGDAEYAEEAMREHIHHSAGRTQWARENTQDAVLGS